MSLFHRLFATWFWLGYSRKAPGTMGSLGTLPFIFAILYFAPYFPTWQLGSWVINAFLPLSFVLFFLAIPSVTWMIKKYDNEDPQMVVVDEVAGQMLAFAFLPPLFITQNIWVFALGFALFRFFDILKPLGIKKLENLPGAWGVMSDDMLGGIYAGLVCTVICSLFP